VRLAEQQKTAEAVAMLGHSDIRGPEPQGHDSPGAASDVGGFGPRAYRIEYMRMLLCCLVNLRQLE
jgi:hypothetical protein